MFCVYIRFRLKLWRLQSINQRSLGDCDQAVPSILDTEHLLETNYELSTWNSFVSFSSGPRGQGVLRQRDLDLKIWDWGRHTSMTRCQHAVTVSLNLIRNSYLLGFSVYSHLCSSAAWNGVTQAGGDLVMMFPGYDELLREDSRTNWRIWVWCSPQGESSSTELKMIWREITITQTSTRGRIMTEFI